MRSQSLESKMLVKDTNIWIRDKEYFIREATIVRMLTWSSRFPNLKNKTEKPRHKVSGWNHQENKRMNIGNKNFIMCTCSLLWLEPFFLLHLTQRTIPTLDSKEYLISIKANYYVNSLSKMISEQKYQCIAHKKFKDIRSLKNCHSIIIFAWCFT